MRLGLRDVPGETGDGKGDVATDLKLKMRDESDPATLKHLSDGALFYIITKGKHQMPPYAGRVKDEGVWDLVNYVRSFAKKGAAADNNLRKRGRRTEDRSVARHPS